MKICTRCLESKSLESFRTRMSRGQPYVNARCRGCESPREQLFYRRHQLTKEQYERMYETQNGICANKKCINKATHIDHSHDCCNSKNSCGDCVRGILCNWCNTILGFSKDDPEILRAAADYIEKYKNSPVER